MRIKFLPSDRITVEAEYNSRLSMQNRNKTYGIEKQDNLSSKLLKGIVRYSPDDNLTFGTRLDYKITQPDGSRGMLLFQDISYRFRKIPVSVWFRYCIFKTDDWDSRLYTYENDLLYSFSIPALSGEGSRSYLMISCKTGKFLDFRIKYAFTEIQPDKDSGKETEELKIQVRMWF
jgi:hypothetical protein